jgi:hypothetical protein
MLSLVPGPSARNENSSSHVRFQVFTAVTVKNAVLWDIKNPVHTSQETH